MKLNSLGLSPFGLRKSSRGLGCAMLCEALTTYDEFLSEL